MRLHAIDDPMDPRVADYRDVKDAELRRRAGLFVAESRAVVHRLLVSPRFPTRSVLLTQPALDGLRDALAACDAPVYLTTHEIARQVVGFDFHRGCMALGERGHEPRAEALIDATGPRLVVALEGVSNPDNVGAVFRNASVLGADAILLSGGCADPLYRKTIRVSMGAALHTPFAHVVDWARGLARLRQAGYTIVALTPDPRAHDIARVEPMRAGSRVALLLGAEHRGLGPLSRAAADLAVRIAMAPGADSLNVATAAAIALHRLRAP
jgi:tRNA G18 (ribose-2'-O)-methylase SpoU